MTDNQVYGLGTLLAIGATVVGYVVYLLVPERHFPKLAGVLAANAVMASLALSGIEVAGALLGYFVLSTILFSWIVLE